MPLRLGTCLNSAEWVFQQTFDVPRDAGETGLFRLLCRLKRGASSTHTLHCLGSAGGVRGVSQTFGGRYESVPGVRRPSADGANVRSITHTCQRMNLTLAKPACRPKDGCLRRTLR